MTALEDTPSLEAQIEQWRSYLRRRSSIRAIDVAELEDHLREQTGALMDRGLAPDEAFLVAVKRMGELDTVAREFAREYSGRLWKQLVVGSAASDASEPGIRRDAIIAFCLASVAALAVKVPEIFGLRLAQDTGFYARNMSLFVLPILAVYFLRKRDKNAVTWRWLAVGVGLAVFFANVYPFAAESYTQVLTALHLPIALWLLVGVAYAGGQWQSGEARMNFVRFSGELFIYYVLIALGGGVLMGFTAGIFAAIGVHIEPFLQLWLLPCGALGAVIVGSWLVEAKQSVIENMAPVLARLFTPLFAAVLLAFLAATAWTGQGIDIERDMLIAFDLLLAVVLGLLLYSVSARDPQAPAGFFDLVQVVLVISALFADAVALWAIAARITEFGFSPNRIAALGENVILLVNLGWSAVLYLRFLRKRAAFSSLECWQTAYLPVYGVWATIVVVVFPPLFRYV